MAAPAGGVSAGDVGRDGSEGVTGMEDGGLAGAAQSSAYSPG